MKKVVSILLTFWLIFMYIQLNQDSIVIQDNTMILEAEIKGEVLYPGVYEIKKDETLNELIERAGGFTQQADSSSLSLMKNVNHKDVIVIPKKKIEERISINTASLEELMKLPGIGESKATSIIQYRNEKSFKTIEDIKKIKGIGDKIFEKIKNQICL